MTRPPHEDDVLDSAGGMTLERPLEDWESCQRKLDCTKTRLLEAAGEVFAKRGFQAATIREICSRAGVHVGAVNYHFRDKDGLYAAVMEYSHTLSQRKFPNDLGVKANASVEERLEAFIRSLLLRMLSDGLPAWHGQLMAQEVSNPTAFVNAAMMELVRPTYVHLARIVHEMLHGSPPADETFDDLTFLCTISMFGQCVEHFIGRNFIQWFKPRTFDPLDIERIVESITRFSIAGINALRPAGADAG